MADPERPVYGTCAGMILMAEPDGVGGGKRQGDGKAWGGMKGMKVWRNLYGGEYGDSAVLVMRRPAFSSPVLS